MRLFASVIAAAILAGPAIAEARAADKPIPAMPLGAAMRVPTGFADLCVRHPADCVADPAQADEAELQAMKTWAARTLWSGLFDTRGALPGPASVGRAFHAPSTTADWTASAASDQAPGAPDAEAEAIKAATTDIDMAALKNINITANRSIISATDRRAFGREDFWAAPEDGARFGDCEDYVLAKRAALIDAGVPRSALSIALVETFRGELHAVLLVAMPKGEVVLDNLSSRITPWDKAPYRWRTRQVAGSAQAWVSVDADGSRRWR